MASDLDRIAEALPTNFDFYHLGNIQLQEDDQARVSIAAPDPLTSVDRVAVAFVLNGDVQGLLLLAFDQGLDISTYSEAGNIIASRLATELEARHGWDIAISPPRFLSAKAIPGYLNGGHGIARTYLHQHDKRIVTLQALVVPSSVVPWEGTGNA